MPILDKPIRGALAGAMVALVAACAQVPAVVEPGGSPAPSQTAPVQTPTPTPTPEPATLRMVFSGDMLWHDSLMVSLRADAKAAKSGNTEEYGPLLQYVAPLIRDADVAVCHTEVPFAPPGTKPSGYPAFGAPASVVRAYRELEFDYCTTASNHSRDRGHQGLIHTLDVLEKELGIVTAGTSRSAEETAPRLLTTPSGVRIAVVTGTYALNNGFDKARPWSVDSLDGMVGRAKAARAAGADIVVASMHAGQEYVTAPTAQQKTLARSLAESGAVDLIVGHHTHTVQPITRVGDVWVAYGMGNLLGQMRHSTPRAMEGILVDATFARSADGRWRVQELAHVPLLVTWNTPQDGPARIYPIHQSLAAGIGPTKRLQASLGHIRKAVGQPEGLQER